MAGKPKTKLGEWMKANRYSDKAFADEVSSRAAKTVTSHAVFNWRHGLSMPRSGNMHVIKEITNGQVMPNDFVLVEQQP